MTVRILVGDCRERLAELPGQSVQCCVTSPPYFGLRDYGTGTWVGGDAACPHVRLKRDASSTLDGTRDAEHEIFRLACPCGAERVDRQIGLEPTPDAFVAELVSVFREVRRVLADDGTLWLNLGDSYSGSWGSQGHRITDSDDASWHGSQIKNHPKRASKTGSIKQAGLKPKDLIGIPWMVAFALRTDGWFLRQDIIWSKPNPMPESVTDRCTKAHEYLFLLSKSARYHYDGAAIAEPLGETSIARLAQDFDAQIGSERVPGKTNGTMKAVGGRRAAGNKTLKGTTAYEAGDERFRTHEGLVDFASRERAKVEEAGDLVGTRNRRTVWTVATQPFSEAHFATFPPALIEPCILAGCPKGGMVLDPFGGAGTTGLVADRLGRNATLIELNPAYAEIARNRLATDAGMFSSVEVAA